MSDIMQMHTTSHAGPAPGNNVVQLKTSGASRLCVLTQRPSAIVHFFFDVFGARFTR